MWLVDPVSEVMGCCPSVLTRDLQLVSVVGGQVEQLAGPDSDPEPLLPRDLESGQEWSPEAQPEDLDSQVPPVGPVCPVSRDPHTHPPLVCQLPEGPPCQPPHYTQATVTSPSLPPPQWAEY